MLNFNLYLLFRFRLSFFSRLAFILFSSRFRTSIKLNDMYQLTIDHQYSILTCVCTHTQPLFSNDLSIQIRCLSTMSSHPTSPPHPPPPTTPHPPPPPNPYQPSNPTHPSKTFLPRNNHCSFGCIYRK